MSRWSCARALPALTVSSHCSLRGLLLPARLLIIIRGGGERRRLRRKEKKERGGASLVSHPYKQISATRTPSYYRVQIIRILMVMMKMTDSMVPSRRVKLCRRVLLTSSFYPNARLFHLLMISEFTLQQLALRPT